MGPVGGDAGSESEILYSVKGGEIMAKKTGGRS